MTLAKGEVFAGYTVLDQIGAGGMGEVYLAQHPRLPRHEALKVLRPEISNDETFQQRFIREADSIAALEHPNVVTVHDRGEADGRLWIATQFVDGTDAARLVQDRYPVGMSADEVTMIITAIAHALDYAHGRGLLHRDVKPANILLTDPDHEGHRRVYLADFGIARPLEDPSGLTSTNFTLGTFAYAAPEQLAGKEMNGRADQYGLAATAYHLLTGTTLYPDANPVAVISRHLTEAPPAASSIKSSLAPFDSVLARALAKNPDDRYASCRDFANAMAAAGRDSGGYSPSAPTQEAPVPKPESAASHRIARGSRTAAIAASTVTLSVALGSLLLWRPWAGGDQPGTPPSTSSTSSTAAPIATSSAKAGNTTSSREPLPPPPPVQTEVATTVPRAATVKLYDECTDYGATGTGADGSTYYCAQIGGTEGYIWSLAPGRGAPNPYPRPGTTCTDPGANSRNAVYGPVSCRADNNGGFTWQLGTSGAPAANQSALPAYSAPWGPQPNEPCAVLGSVAYGSQGLMDCKQWVSGGVIIGQFWGPTPPGYGG